jgi:regulator of replication initiation timing
MSAEKDILNFWLNQKGYFTINKIKAKNRDIGILAIGQQFNHFVITLSVRSTFLESGDVKKSVNSFYKENFEDKLAVKKLQELIQKHSGKKKSYDKSVVLGMLPSQKKKEIIKEFADKEVTVYEFAKVLSEVIKGLETHYYRDNVIRSLQLIKYLLLNRPVTLAKLLQHINIQKHTFIKHLLRQAQVRKSLSKGTEENQLITLLKNSTLNKPEKLAQVIVEEILGARSKRKFLMALLSHEDMRKIFISPEPVEPISDKDQQKLAEFI